MFTIAIPPIRQLQIRQDYYDTMKLMGPYMGLRLAPEVVGGANDSDDIDNTDGSLRAVAKQSINRMWRWMESMLPLEGGKNEDTRATGRGGPSGSGPSRESPKAGKKRSATYAGYEAQKPSKAIKMAKGETPNTTGANADQPIDLGLEDDDDIQSPSREMKFTKSEIPATTASNADQPIDLDLKDDDGFQSPGETMKLTGGETPTMKVSS